MADSDAMNDLARFCAVGAAVMTVVIGGLRLAIVRNSAPTPATAMVPAGAADAAEITSGYVPYYKPSSIHQIVNPQTAASLAGLTQNDAYPVELLVEAADLARPEFARNVHILDARPWENYKTSHIAGATHVDLAAWEFRGNSTQRNWEHKIGMLGVDRDTPVIVYDDGSHRYAARIWWILRYWGVKSVRVLNGGWPAWQGQGAHQDRAQASAQHRYVILAPDSTRWSRLSDAAVSQASPKARIVCSSYTGALLVVRTLNWFDVIDRRAMRFKTASQLDELFESAGIDLARLINVQCDSVDEAAPLAFAFELMGARDVCVQSRAESAWAERRKTP